MARLSTLILLVSKRSTRGSPQPHWPPAPSAWPLRTVESPTRNRVRSLGLAGGLRPILAWAAGSVVAPSMGRDLAGVCARSPALMRKRESSRDVLAATCRREYFGIGIVYALRGSTSSWSVSAYSRTHDLDILGTPVRVV